ncbi:hypothetical protein GJ496_011152 [Pomphorhynchus laevis]|nr:hypothetical protein GJ496_011152 [Pomphorhynchus laevis]
MTSDSYSSKPNTQKDQLSSEPASMDITRNYVLSAFLVAHDQFVADVNIAIYSPQFLIWRTTCRYVSDNTEIISIFTFHDSIEYGSALKSSKDVKRLCLCNDLSSICTSCVCCRAPHPSIDCLASQCSNRHGPSLINHIISQQLSISQSAQSSNAILAIPALNRDEVLHMIFSSPLLITPILF